MSNIFWGIEVFESSIELSDSVGVKIGNTRMLNSTYASARKIANAGSDGVLTGDIFLTDITILRNAGVPIESDDVGARYFMKGALPLPDKYLVPKPKSAPTRYGQFGASLETITY